MENSLAIRRTLAAFLYDFMYNEMTPEWVEEYLKEEPIILSKMAFDLRDRIQSDPMMSEKYKERLGLYDMSI